MQADLRKDYFWNTLGVFLQNAISPLLLVVITRVNGIYDSGLFSFAFSLAIIFWAVGMWGGRTYQVSDVKHEFSHRSYVVVRLVLAAVMLVAAVLFSLVNNYDATKTSIIVLLVLFKAVESIADSIYGIMQTHDRLFVAGKSLTYKAIGSFSSFVIIDVLTKDIVLASLSILLVNVLIVLVYDLPVVRKLVDINIRPGYLKRYIHEAGVIMKRCAPVFLVSFLAMFSLNIPRYFVDTYHGEEIGYFGILAMPVTLIVLIVLFILQPNTVGLSKLYDKAKYTEFNKVVWKILSSTILIGTGILLVTLIAGVPLLEAIFGVSFADYAQPLVIVVAGAVANAVVGVFIYLLTIMRHFKEQLYILLGTNLFLVVASAFIVKTYGLVGGVSSFALVSVMQTALLMAVYYWSLKKAKNAKKD